MLEQLKFVQRGVARRDFVPGLTHFRIQGGRVTGYNGNFCLSSPVEIGFDCAPEARFFIQALNACEDVITLKLDEHGNLLVRSGQFRTAVPCIPLDQVPSTVPEGVPLQPHGSILDAFKSLKEFVGVDASRAWAMGILLAGQSAFATNNIIIAEYWLATPFPHVVNIPGSIVEEVVRINEELVCLQIADGSITFHYADGRWVKSQLLALNWPDVVMALTEAWKGGNLQPVHPQLYSACEKLAQFGDKDGARIYFRGTDVASKKEGAVQGGALFEMTNIPDRGVYQVAYLKDVLDVATQIDLTRYPAPIPFLGDKLRGAMVGLRDDV